MCDRCLRKGSRCAYSASLPKGRRRAHPDDGKGGASEAVANGPGPTDTSPQSQMSTTMDSDGLSLDDLIPEEGSARNFDWFGSIDPALCDQVLSSFALFPSSQEQRPNNQMNDVGNSSIGKGFDDRSDAQTHTTKDDPEFLIAQLAQLSTLISLLRRSQSDLIRDLACPSLADHNQPETIRRYSTHQLPVIGDSVFESVTAWLSRGPTDTTLSCCSSHACQAQAPKIKTLGDLLYHVFSASYRLVELVRPAPVAAVSSNAAIAISGIDHANHCPNSVNHSLSGDGSTIVGPELTQVSAFNSQSSNAVASMRSVIRHLFIANHSMLLEMYSRILGLLQRYVDQTVLEGGAVPLLAIRLASVVHTCSYLIDRQHQALELYLPPLIGCLVEAENTADVTQSVKAISDEIKQRILFLQQTTQV
ncbi:hypothetical protein NM208_g11013 [Fusarium decemcellulare]|uniref:Uncharacterized protein n=1 Tax=Fusarium decemcellulare TaxID=57161 RepID=A0ACC1RVT8_9HYPO|nr:hypothetical protein NM208_g11013 [Fusarium decemcellulare]